MSVYTAHLQGVLVQLDRSVNDGQDKAMICVRKSTIISSLHLYMCLRRDSFEPMNEQSC